MNRRSRQCPDRPQAPSDSPAATGYGALATRIAGWTSSGLLTAVVLVAGLGFGRQVLRWWAEDVPESSMPARLRVDDGLGDRAKLHHMVFGDALMAMSTRTVVAEDEDKLAELLVAQCRDATPRDIRPQEPATDQDRRLLASLADREPEIEEPGRWRIYHVDGDGFVPLAVMTQPVQASLPDMETPSRGGGDIALPEWRVVSWTLGMPGEPPTWTLYTFHASSVLDVSAADQAPFRLPPDSERIMSARVELGGELVAFRGPTSGEDWKPFFDRSYERQGWNSTVSRSTGDGSWHLQYRDDSSKGHTVDIRFGPGRDGLRTGLLISTSVTPNGK